MQTVKTYKNRKGQKVIISKMPNNYLIRATSFFKRTAKRLGNILSVLYSESDLQVVKEAIDLIQPDFERTTRTAVALNQELIRRGI